MDYKELADLIFPDAKEISYYEEKYPERNLSEGAMVTRIGPSPTGNVHIGTIYQALINLRILKMPLLLSNNPHKQLFICVLPSKLQELYRSQYHSMREYALWWLSNFGSLIKWDVPTSILAVKPPLK